MTTLGLRACFEDALFGLRIITIGKLLNVLKELNQIAFRSCVLLEPVEVGLQTPAFSQWGCGGGQWYGRNKGSCMAEAGR